MDFTEYGAERNIVDARDLPKGTQNRDESKRLLDDVRAIEAPERQMILPASVRQLRPGAFYRGAGDAPAPISNRQFSPPASPSSKQKLLVIFTVAVGIAGGVAIGVVFSAANTVRLALKVSEVTHSLARLVGGWSDSVAEGTTPTAAPAAIAEQIPATHSAQIPSAAQSGGAPLDHVPAPAQTTSSNVAPALLAELAQPPAATAEYDKVGQSGEGDLPIDRNVSVVNAQPNASSPLTEGQEDELCALSRVSRMAIQSSQAAGSTTEVHYILRSTLRDRTYWARILPTFRMQRSRERIHHREQTILVVTVRQAQRTRNEEVEPASCNEPSRALAGELSANIVNDD